MVSQLDHLFFSINRRKLIFAISDWHQPKTNPKWGKRSILAKI